MNTTEHKMETKREMDKEIRTREKEKKRVREANNTTEEGQELGIACSVDEMKGRQV